MIFNTYNEYRGTWIRINFMLMLAIGYFIAAFATSAIITLLVETPFINIERVFIFPKEVTTQGRHGEDDEKTKSLK